MGLRLDPIVIVGFALKFPGECDSPESFWNVLAEKRSTATEFPPDRLSADATYHPDPNRRGTLPFRGGHFIKDDISKFDAPFFSISDVEAAALDPQQRGLLETTYRALENAGQPLDKVIGSKTSVYTGCFMNDWQHLSLQESDQCPAHAGLGIEASMNANRISWFFNFQGTSFNVDSACSSSLVSLDLACKSLHDGDTDMSVAAGCNLILYPDIMHALSNLNLLSPDNQCYSFDSRANGYARGEGFGVLILKRLSDAIQNKDTIRAVIRATGSNQDGYTPGITQPSGEAQVKLIRDTYAKAGLSLEHTRYFEAHGTGTEIGDPIEANAIGDIFRSARLPNDPLYVGSVKANIGHLEGASGIAGVIKAILVLEKGVITPNTNLIVTNPRIDTEFLRIKLPLESTSWPSRGLRRVSVNSFGFGGTNAHAILDDALHYLNERGLDASHNTIEYPVELNGVPYTNGYELVKGTPKVLALSANDEDTLKRQVKMYSSYFNNISKEGSAFQTYLDDLVYTLNSRRTALPWKSSVIVESMDDLHHLDMLVSPPTRSVTAPTIAFVFTGQGAQYPAEILQQLNTFHIFSQILQEAEDYLLQLGCPWELREELFRDAEHSNINKAEYSQPITTAVQVALIDLVRSFHVHPTVVVGHSSGEIAAAYCLGAISAKSAWKLAYFRGVFSATKTSYNIPQGAMISVGLSEDKVLPYIQDLAQETGAPILSVACTNSPKNVTLAGQSDQIDLLAQRLKDEGVFARKLNVNMAYHSPAMTHSSQLYAQSLGKLERGAAPLHPITMISSMTGKWISEAELCSPQYWVNNMISPVKFSSAIGGLGFQAGRKLRRKLDRSHRSHLKVTFLLEIGFHSALQGPIRDILRECPGGNTVGYASTLVRGQAPLTTLVKSMAQLYCHGYNLDLDHVNRLDKDNGNLRVLPDLPQYAFNHTKTYWEEGRVSQRLRLHPQAKLDLLGRPSADWNPLEAKWRNFIRISEMPWVEDHRINGSLIYPGAGMLVMAIEAANQMADKTRTVVGFTLKDVSFYEALNIPLGSQGVETHLYLRQSRGPANSATWTEFRICSMERGDWQENCCGFIRTEYKVDQGRMGYKMDVQDELAQFRQLHESFRPASNELFDHSMLYETLQKSGFEFGSSFHRVHNGIFDDKFNARADVSVYEWPSSQYPQPHVIHPCTLDGILHVCVAALAQGGRKSISTDIPSSIKRLWISRTGLCQPETALVKAAASVVNHDSRGNEFNISVLDEAKSRLLVRVDGMRSTRVSNFDEPSSNTSFKKQTCYNIGWRPDVSLMTRDAISEYCAAARNLAPEPVEFYQDLTFVLLAFLSNAVEEMGDKMPSDSPQHHVKYMNWAKTQLVSYRSGDLPHAESEWQDLLKDADIIEKACQRVETANDLGRIFVAVGRNLIPMLRGEINPLEFLFESDLLKDLYRHINNDRTCFPEFARYLDAFGHKNPTIKILEIGAGTGATTEKVLAVLSAPEGSTNTTSRYSSYYYTDISPSFFEIAQEQYSQHPNMFYKPLDIEVEPTAQGFEANSFDLVIAANVLHATEDMNSTLRNVRTLLKPGGTLMMYEPTRPDILRTAFITGLLPGWWRSSEIDSCSPILTNAAWETALRISEFSGVDLELPDYRDPRCHEGSILLSTAAYPRDDERPVIRNVVIVADENSDLQSDFAKRLKSTMLIEENINCSILTWQDAVKLESKENVSLVFVYEIAGVFTTDLSEDEYSALQKLTTSSKGVVWISAGGGVAPGKPDYGIANGLFRSLRNENPERPCSTVALDLANGIAEKQLQGICKVFHSTQLSPEPLSLDMEYVEIDGYFNIPRVLHDKELSQELFIRSLPEQSGTYSLKDCPPLSLKIESTGFLDTLHFAEDTNYQLPLAEDEVEVEVRATGLNLKDCLIALGRVPGSTFGSECAGTVSRVGSLCGFQPGDRVVMASAETFKTFARGKINHTLKIDDTMEFSEAASIPAQFCTAWQVMYRLARVQAGESVLIHAGAGGTGQAAIQVSQYLGATVYATVSSETKKNVLVDVYGIPEDHIFYSRDTSFAKGIMRATGGRGVDVVLNSLAGDSLVASWECIAPYGRFVEIGKRDILTNSNLPMFPFLKNASFLCFDGAAWHFERPHEAQATLREVFDLFAQKKLHTVHPIHLYSAQNVESAFRALQDGKSPGKVVLEFTPESKVKTILATQPSFSLDGNATYVVTGGLGGLGRSIARWMVGRGARYLILLSRSGPKTTASKELLEELAQKGTTVATPSCDLTNFEALKSALACCASNMPHIKGAIQGAMVLKDAIFDKMTYDDWRIATDCKTIGSWNLHSLLPNDLDFFVLLSSASGIVGLRGQANYAAGNTYMDALARYRVAGGQRAISLDLGALTDDGRLAETPELLNRVLAYGALNPIPREQFYAILDYYCNPSLPLLSTQQCQSIIGLGSGAGPGLDGISVSRQAIFRHLNDSNEEEQMQHGPKSEQKDWKALFSTAASFLDAATIISQALISKLQRTLSTLMGEVDMNKPLATYGVDSLLAVELRSWIAKEFLADVATFDIWGASSFSTLSTLIASRSKIKHVPWIG